MSDLGPKVRNWSEGKGPFLQTELPLHVKAHAKELRAIQLIREHRDCHLLQLTIVSALPKLVHRGGKYTLSVLTPR